MKLLLTLLASAVSAYEIDLRWSNQNANEINVLTLDEEVTVVLTGSAGTGASWLTNADISGEAGVLRESERRGVYRGAEGITGGPQDTYITLAPQHLGTTDV